MDILPVALPLDFGHYNSDVLHIVGNFRVGTPTGLAGSNKSDRTIVGITESQVSAAKNLR